MPKPPLVIVQKGELLQRLGWIIERLRGAPAHSPDLVLDMLAIEQALVPLEAALAVAIDQYMSNQYERHNKPAPQTDLNGLSGQWGRWHRG
jgi:hypothetical protein